MLHISYPTHPNLNKAGRDLLVGRRELAQGELDQILQGKSTIAVRSAKKLLKRESNSSEGRVRELIWSRRMLYMAP